MAANHVELLRSYRFRRAGRYSDGVFTVDPAWRPRQVVYVWTHGTTHTLTPLRVGIACGPNGFGRRYDHYNRWLAGRFKPNDAREQQVRAVFLEGLRDSALVWAVEVADKPQALELEGLIRRRWGSVLSLDLMVRDSWAKRRMNDWRAAERGGPRSPQTVSRQQAEPVTRARFGLVPPQPTWLRTTRGLGGLFLWAAYLLIAVYWATAWLVWQLVVAVRVRSTVQRGLD
jgi:hypothetical protein